MKSTGVQDQSSSLIESTAGNIYADPDARRKVLMAIRDASDGKWIVGRTCLKALRPVIGVRRNTSELLRLFKRHGMLTARRGPRSAKKATQIRLTARAKRFLAGHGNGVGELLRRRPSGNDLGGKINAYLRQFDSAVQRRGVLAEELAALNKFIKAHEARVHNLRAALKDIAGIS